MSALDKGAVQHVDTAGDRLDKGAIEFSQSAPDITEPTLQSASINSAGTQLSVVFDEAVTGSTGITISASGGASTATYASGDTTTTLVFSLSRTIQSGEAITLAYTPGNIEDLAGNPLGSVADQEVTNNSTADTGAPTIQTATINSAGTQLSLQFNENVTGSTGITLTSVGRPAITATYTSGSGTNTLVFNLSRTVWDTETVTLDYSPGNIVDGATNALEAVSDQAVTNNSTQSPAWTMVLSRDGSPVVTVEAANVAGLEYTLDPHVPGNYTATVTLESSGSSQVSNAVTVTTT